jgi:uncharacterized protein with FMN-binding domain
LAKNAIGPHTTPEKDRTVYLEERLARPGRHELKFKVTPHATVWSVVLQISVEDKNGKITPVHLVDLNSTNRRTESEVIPLIVAYEAARP